jgi:hypothetical protein
LARGQKSAFFLVLANTKLPPKCVQSDILNYITILPAKKGQKALNLPLFFTYYKQNIVGAVHYCFLAVNFLEIAAKISFKLAIIKAADNF